MGQEGQHPPPVPQGPGAVPHGSNPGRDPALKATNYVILACNGPCVLR